jgi:hypothetical protein
MPTVCDPDYVASIGAAGASAVFPGWHDEGLLRLLEVSVYYG